MKQMLEVKRVMADEIVLDAKVTMLIRAFHNLMNNVTEIDLALKLLAPGRRLNTLRADQKTTIQFQLNRALKTLETAQEELLRHYGNEDENSDATKDRISRTLEFARQHPERITSDDINGWINILSSIGPALAPPVRL